MNNLKLLQISYPGVPNQERIVMNVLSKDNTGRYIAVKSLELSTGSISSKISDVYWFPDKEILPGEVVILYTCRGTNTEFVADNGTKVHVFFWGLSRTILNTSTDSVAVMALESWNYKARGK